MSKIFITGCAKTGTTLLRRLFNAFDLKVYNKEEIRLENFVNTQYDVGKRTVKQLFSNVLSETEIKRNLKILKDNEVKVINVMRNKKDVLKSTNGYVTKKRYEHSVKQANDYKDYIDFTVTYEEIIEDCDKVQSKIAEHFGLKIVHKWSDFPEWFDDSEEPKGGNWDNKNYSLRPIGKKY